MNFPERDIRWEGTNLTELNDFQMLSRNLLHFHEHVPEDITKSFVLVMKLITYSYFEYEFLDAALERSLINFELSLRYKYLEMTGERIKDAEKKDLGDLIEWAHRKSLIEVDKKRMHGLRKYRNSSMHRYSYELSGYLSFNILSFIVRWINDLYDAADLRIERKRILRKVNKELKEYSEWGGTVHLPDKKVKITEIELVYFNNKKSPKTFTFLLNQYFDLPIDSKEFSNEDDILDGLSTPPPITIECQGYELKDSRIHFLPATKETAIKFEKNSKEKGKQNMKWKKFINNNTQILKSILKTEKTKLIDKSRL